MTRNEFVNSIFDFYDLMDFCRDYGCEYCEDIYDDDALDEEVEYDIREHNHEHSWRSLLDCLRNIPAGYDFYRKYAPFEYEGLDNEDFLDCKNEVCDWADLNGYFEDDITEPQAVEKEELVDDEEPVDEFIEEDFPISELMIMSADMLTVLRHETECHIREMDREFEEFICQTPAAV